MCGLAAASHLLFCLYNGITSTKQKKRRSQQFLGQAALFSHLGRSWGFWCVGPLSAAPCQGIHAQTLGRSETVSRGISCRSPRNEALGSRLTGFTWLCSANFCFGKHTCVCCDNFHRQTVRFKMNSTPKWMFFLDQMNMIDIRFPTPVT